VCQYVFPPPEKDLSDTPDDAPLFSDEAEVHEVFAVKYYKHDKVGKTPSLRVEYCTSLIFNRWHKEWICLEHGGVARAKAVRWWCARTDAPIPPDIDTALDYVKQLDVPSSISVKRDGKYWRITDYEF
jgi:DNA repair protein RadD